MEFEIVDKPTITQRRESRYKIIVDNLPDDKAIKIKCPTNYKLEHFRNTLYVTFNRSGIKINTSIMRENNNVYLLIWKRLDDGSS
jgi:hypothetical protein